MIKKSRCGKKRMPWYIRITPAPSIYSIHVSVETFIGSDLTYVIVAIGPLFTQPDRAAELIAMAAPMFLPSTSNHDFISPPQTSTATTTNRLAPTRSQCDVSRRSGELDRGQSPCLAIQEDATATISGRQRTSPNHSQDTVVEGAEPQHMAMMPPLSAAPPSRLTPVFEQLGNITESVEYDRTTDRFIFNLTQNHDPRSSSEDNITGSSSRTAFRSCQQQPAPSRNRSRASKNGETIVPQSADVPSSQYAKQRCQQSFLIGHNSQQSGPSMLSDNGDARPSLGEPATPPEAYVNPQELHQGDKGFEDDDIDTDYDASYNWLLQNDHSWPPL